MIIYYGLPIHVIGFDLSLQTKWSGSTALFSELVDNETMQRFRAPFFHSFITFLEVKCQWTARGFGDVRSMYSHGVLVQNSNTASISSKYIWNFDYSHSPNWFFVVIVMLNGFSIEHLEYNWSILNSICSVQLLIPEALRDTNPAFVRRCGKYSFACFSINFSIQ